MFRAFMMGIQNGLLRLVAWKTTVQERSLSFLCELGAVPVTATRSLCQLLFISQRVPHHSLLMWKMGRSLRRHAKMAEKSIQTIQNIVNGRSDSPLQLNHAQCKYLAQELAKLNIYLQGRYDMLKAGQDARQIAWLHLHSVIIRAELLVEKCCCKNVESWLLEAKTLVETQEDFAAIILDLHHWRMAMDVTIADVMGASCDYKQIFLDIMDAEYQEAYKRLRSRDHALQQAALEDRKEIISKLAEVQESEDSLEYLCALHLQSWLAELENGTHLTNRNAKQKLITHVSHENSSLLGMGATGSVHRVNWLGVQCALKKLQVKDEREATVLKGLHHPNIVRLYLYWDEIQTPYEADGYSTDGHEIRPLPKSNLLMELMHTDLSGHIKMRMKRKASSSGEGEEMMPFSLPVAIDIMLQVGNALRYMHNKHLTHRDLKTANILVRRVNKALTDLYNEGYLEIKLADFGLTKAYENTSTSQWESVNAGTRRYGAPEVFEKDWSADRKFPPMADVWSFGMTCCEILSGKMPYANEDNRTLRALHTKITKGNLRPALPKLCPEYLAFIIRGCWELQPERRPNFESICTMLSHAKLLSLGITKVDDSERFLRYTPRRGFEQILQDPRLHVGDGLREINMAKTESAQCGAKVASTLLKFVQENEQNFEMQDEGAIDALVSDLQAALEDENADTRADAVLALDLLSRIITIQTEKLSCQMLSPFLRPDCKEELKEAAARLLALVFRNARSAKVFMEGPDSLRTLLHLLEKDLTSPSIRECAYELLKLATEEDDSIRLELPSAGLVKLIKSVTALDRDEDKEYLTTVLYLLCKNGNEVDVTKAEGHIFLVSSLGDNKSKEAAVRGLWILLNNPATEDAVLGAGFVGAAVRSINSHFASSETALALAQTSLSSEALDEMALALAKISWSSKGLDEIVECGSSEGAVLSLLAHCSSIEGKGAAAVVIAKLYPKLAILEDRSRHQKLSNASSLLFKCLKETDKSQLKEFLKALAVLSSGEKDIKSIHEDRGVEYLIQHFESELSDTEVRRLVLQIFAEMSIVFTEIIGYSLSRTLLKDAFRTNEIGKRLCRLWLMEDNSESRINLLKIIRNYSEIGEGARDDLGADAAMSVLLEVVKRNSLRGNVPEVNELALGALAKFMEDASRRKAFIASHGITTVADVLKLNPLMESVLCYCIVILAKVIEDSKSKRVPCEAIFNCKVLSPLKDAMFHAPSNMVKWQAVVLVHWVVLYGPTSSVCTAIRNEGVLDAVIELLRIVPDCKEVTTELLKTVRKGDKKCRILIDEELKRLNITL